MKLKKILVGLAIMALLVLIVKKAAVISAVAGPLGGLLVAGAVAVLAVVFVLLVVLPLLGLIFAGIAFVILLAVLGGALSVPFAIFHGHHMAAQGGDEAGDGDGADDTEASEIREMPAFDRLQVSGDMALLVIGGGGHAVAVKGDEDSVKALKSQVKDGLLTLHESAAAADEGDDDDAGDDNGIRVAVSTEKLKAFKSKGTAAASLQRLDADNFSLDLAGTGEIEAAGRCGTLTVHMTGGGRLNSGNLKCDNVVLTMEGVGAAKIFAAKSLKVNISGPGQVTYAGAPAKIERNISGSGSLSPE